MAVGLSGLEKTLSMCKRPLQSHTLEVETAAEAKALFPDRATQAAAFFRRSMPSQSPVDTIAEPEWQGREFPTVTTQRIGPCTMQLELPPLERSSIFFCFFCLPRLLAVSVPHPFLQCVILDCILLCKIS